MTTTVLFDLDGTLLDSERDFTRILNAQLAAYGKPAVTTEQMRNTVSSGARAMVMLGFGIDDNDPRFPALLDELLERYDDCIPRSDAELFPGIEPLLDTFNRQDTPWGIVTNKPSRFTMPLIEKFQALQASHVVICADHVKERKPDPEGILMACQTLRCAPADTLYVGDHPKDVQASAAAGTRSVGVRWGYIPEEHPIDTWRADHVISTPAEILALIGS